MKIACVSISRSDWNALGMVAKALREKGAEVAAHYTTGHEAPEMLEADGFTPIHDGLNNPDMIVLCGDRYVTTLAALQAARASIPIAHLAGGDITEGSTDDSYRHAITKLAHLHFPTHAEAAQRIRQMGEEPWRVMNYGSASIDRIRATPLLSREQTMLECGLATDAKNVVVLNWQPMGTNNQGDLLAILTALDGMPDLAVLAVGANDDPGGASVNELLTGYGPRLTYRAHLPSRLYLSLLKHCAVMVGNSSSAYYEAAAVGCYAIDVGDRQKGRPVSRNILHTDAFAPAIVAGIQAALNSRHPGPDEYGSPFGSGDAASKSAASIIAHAGDRQRLLRKRFVDHWAGAATGGGPAPRPDDATGHGGTASGGRALGDIDGVGTFDWSDGSGRHV